MKAIKIENEAQYNTAKQWAKDNGLEWRVRYWTQPIWIYILEDHITWDTLTHNTAHQHKIIPFDEFFKPPSFPFSIQCRDLHERDAAAAWLVSHGCLVNGTDNHLNGEYKESFHKSYLTLYVGKKTYFVGTDKVDDSAIPFFENVSKFSKLFKDEIKVGDWVVALNNYPHQFTEGKIYKIASFCSENYFHSARIEVQSDDSGNRNGWFKSNFRKARPDEIPQLPKINGYSGEIKGDIVKYGCAEISLAMLREMDRVMNEKYSGNRTISKIILDSGATISKVEIEQILRAAK